MPIHGNIPQCQYIRTDGRRCGSPRLKSKRYCYFHYEVNRPVAHLDIPPLEDGNAIQLALTDLARAIVEERIALKPAALLAYILQTASANLKRVHLGVFTDHMITELPSLDPYARGLAPLPGERNRDPEASAPSAFQASNPRSSASIRGKKASAPSAFQASGLPERPGAPPRLRASAVKPVSAATAAPPKAPSAFQASDPRSSASIRGKNCSPPSAQTSSASSAVQASAPLSQKIKAAKAGSLKDAQALLGLLKDDLLKDSG